MGSIQIYTVAHNISPSMPSLSLNAGSQHLDQNSSLFQEQPCSNYLYQLPPSWSSTPFNFDLLQILPQFCATNSAECCSSKFRQILPCRSFLQMVALLGWVWKFWPSKLPMRLAADFLRGSIQRVSILERTTWKVSPVVDPLDSSKLVLAQHQGTRKCQQTARPRKLTDVKMEAATSHQLRLSCAGFTGPSPTRDHVCALSDGLATTNINCKCCSLLKAQSLPLPQKSQCTRIGDSTSSIQP